VPPTERTEGERPKMDEELKNQMERVIGRDLDRNRLSAVYTQTMKALLAILERGDELSADTLLAELDGMGRHSASAAAEYLREVIDRTAR